MVRSGLNGPHRGRVTEAITSDHGKSWRPRLHRYVLALTTSSCQQSPPWAAAPLAGDERLAQTQPELFKKQPTNPHVRMLTGYRHLIKEMW